MGERTSRSLRRLARLHLAKSREYGSTYKTYGKVGAALFPGGVELKTEADWARMALVFHCSDKLARYCQNFSRGGHSDSLDDLSVYAQILAEIDAEGAS